MTIQSFFDRDRFLARVDEILPDPSAVLTEDQRSTLETFTLTNFLHFDG